MRDDFRGGRYHAAQLTDESQPIAAPDAAARRLSRLHLRNGWIGVLLFAVLGIFLESLHAWKSPAYLGPGQETRRLMWTLAHAHGVGLSLVQIAFAATVPLAARRPLGDWRLASRLLNSASVLMPLGFFLGGVAPYEGDPGLGVWLVPPGAALLLTAVARIAWTVARPDPHRSR